MPPIISWLITSGLLSEDAILPILGLSSILKAALTITTAQVELTKQILANFAIVVTIPAKHVMVPILKTVQIVKVPNSDISVLLNAFVKVVILILVFNYVTLVNTICLGATAVQAQASVRLALQASSFYQMEFVDVQLDI